MNPKQTSGWPGRASITTQLVSIVLALVAAFALLLAVVALAFQLTAGVRAYVGGEGLWSKGQKDAVYALTRYLQTAAESDWQDYQAAIAIPLGDRRARESLQALRPQPAVVLEGFVAGGNAPEDVPAMSFLFRHFGGVSYFAEAIRIWEQADAEIAALAATADQLHRAIQSAPLSAAQQAEFATRILAVNARVTPLERDFSRVLGVAARKVQGWLLAGTLACAAVLLTLGLSVAARISHRLRASILGLRAGAIRVAEGDLEHSIAITARDELGELAQVFNAMIERRREAEAALRSATDLRNKMMQNASNAIYALDREGRFTLVNRRLCEISGHSEATLIGQNYAMLMPPESAPELAARYAEVIAGGEPIINFETPILRPDGRPVTVVFSTSALIDKGLIVGAAGAAEDITERRRYEAELKKRAEELARSNRELEQFAYVASHDLQEPLRTVTGFAQLLARRQAGKLDAEADEFIGYITAGVERMKSLIEDLLAYSRVTRERQQRTALQLDGCLDAALANLAGAIQASGAVIIREPLPSLPADTQQMTQLLQNLIGNAIKFCSSKAPVICIRAQRQPQGWLISVADNGIGISSEHAERIFGLFQRLNARETYPGNGIGLTICKKIVDLHGGQIRVRPGAEGGSVFEFSLPDV